MLALVASNTDVSWQEIVRTVRSQAFALATRFSLVCKWLLVALIQNFVGYSDGYAQRHAMPAVVTHRIISMHP